METLSQALPIVIYFLLIILLIVLITLGIKLLLAVLKLEKVINDLTKRMESLSGIFNAFDFIADKMSRVGDLVVDFIGEKINKISNKKKKEMDEDE